MRIVHGKKTGLARGVPFLLVLFGTACEFPISAWAGPSQPSAEVLFAQANQVYNKNDFAGAADKYKQLLDTGMASGQLLYNLGNCHFRMGRLGRAMVYYERARRFIPRNRNLLANIALTESRVMDKIVPPKLSLVAQKLFLWRDRLTASEISMLFLGTNAAFWLALATLTVARNRFVKAAVVCIGILLVLSGGSYAFEQIEQRSLGYAIVVADEAAVRTGPGDYGVKFDLHEGARLKLVESREGWFQIRLADGKRGWIGADAVARI